MGGPALRVAWISGENRRVKMPNRCFWMVATCSNSEFDDRRSLDKLFSLFCSSLDHNFVRKCNQSISRSSQIYCLIYYHPCIVMWSFIPLSVWDHSVCGHAKAIPRKLRADLLSFCGRCAKRPPSDSGWSSGSGAGKEAWEESVPIHRSTIFRWRSWIRIWVERTRILQSWSRVGRVRHLCITWLQRRSSCALEVGTMDQQLSWFRTPISYFFLLFPFLAAGVKDKFYVNDVEQHAKILS